MSGEAFREAEEAEDGTLSERKLEATLKMKRSHLLGLMGKLKNNKTGNDGGGKQAIVTALIHNVAQFSCI